MILQDLKNKRIAIVGLGTNNRHLVEYFRVKEINFEVVDGWKTPDDLIGKLDNFEIIFRTPGLPYLSRAIQQAKQKGVVIYSQTKLFFDLCPCPIVGVTGTKGKGTTASLIFEILKSNFQFPIFPPKADPPLADNFQTNPKIQNSKPNIYLAGNIGQDPFEFIEKIQKKDWVVLELSSFQLQDLHKSPHIAVVLKITPEHLDHHATVEEYIDAKKPIVMHQTKKDYAVVNYDYETTRNFAPLTEGSVVWNSTMQKVKPGCYVKGEKIILNFIGSNAPHSLLKVREGEEELWNEEVEIMPVSGVKLIGRFNLENVTAAIAASACAGASDPGVIRKAISEFEGLPHRLELVAEIKGVKFYNDSFSTTPETAIAAISAFTEPIILIVGGSEKNADYGGLARAIASSKIKSLIPIGKTGPKIAKLARAAGFEGRIIDDKLENMEKIVAAANAEADPGDIVLLSPASASFDMFHDYKHRGELFKKYAKKITNQF